jgi:hypothetical protein
MGLKLELLNLFSIFYSLGRIFFFQTFDFKLLANFHYLYFFLNLHYFSKKNHQVARIFN